MRSRDGDNHHELRGQTARQTDSLAVGDGRSQQLCRAAPGAAGWAAPARPLAAGEGTKPFSHYQGPQKAMLPNSSVTEEGAVAAPGTGGSNSGEHGGCGVCVLRSGAGGCDAPPEQPLVASTAKTDEQKPASTSLLPV